MIPTSGLLVPIFHLQVLVYLAVVLGLDWLCGRSKRLKMENTHRSLQIEGTGFRVRVFSFPLKLITTKRG